MEIFDVLGAEADEGVVGGGAAALAAALRSSHYDGCGRLLVFGKPGVQVQRQQGNRKFCFIYCRIGPGRFYGFRKVVG